MANKSTPELLELIDYSLSKLEKLTDIAAAVNTLGTIPQAHARITLAGALSGQITGVDRIFLMGGARKGRAENRRTGRGGDRE